MTQLPADIQPGDVVAVQVRGWVGALIRFGQILTRISPKMLYSISYWKKLLKYSKYEHVAVYVGGNQVVEAETTGAREWSIDEYLDGRLILFSTGRLGISAATGQVIASFAKSYIGIKYSFLDYLAQIAHAWHIPVPGLRRYIASRGHQLCSQLVDSAFTDAGLHVFGGVWEGYIKPMDWALLIDGVRL